MWLRPGHIVTFQPNNNSFTTTDDVMNNGEIHLIANRDENGHAKGRLFKDTGVSRVEIENGIYEHYEFELSANSIKKWNLNPTVIQQVGPGLSSVVITAADDIAGTDFACFSDD